MLRAPVLCKSDGPGHQLTDGGLVETFNDYNDYNCVSITPLMCISINLSMDFKRKDERLIGL